MNIVANLTTVLSPPFWPQPNRGVTFRCDNYLSLSTCRLLAVANLIIKEVDRVIIIEKD